MSLLLAGPAFAAVALVKSVGTNIISGVTTYNYTVQQANSVLVVAAYRDAAGGSYKDITFGGNAASGYLAGSRASLFYYKNPSVGSLTISSVTSASSSGIYIWELSGVDLTATPVGVLGATNNATATQIATVADNSFVVDAIGWNPTGIGSTTTVSIAPDGDNTTITGTNFTYAINFPGGGVLGGGTGVAGGAGTYNLGWTITQSAGAQGDLNELAFGFAPVPVIGAPSVVASVSPASGHVGDSFTVTATVTPGGGTVTNVAVDLSGIGGSSSAKLILQGANVYTNTFTVPDAVVVGTTNLTVTVTDNQPLSGNYVMSFTVLAADHTWDGGSLSGNNWSDIANWTGDVAPTLTGNNLIFAGTTRLTPDMNGNYRTVGLTFDGTAGGFTLGSSGGHVLTLAGDIADNSSTMQTLDLAITNVGNTIHISGGNDMIINGGIAGAGGLEKNGSGTLIMNGTNSFTGGISINSGALQIAGAGLFGGNNGNYAGRITNSGVLQYSSSATQTLSGVVSWFGNVIKDGTGKLVLAGNNTYFADTYISNGVLQVTGTLAADLGNNYIYSIIDQGALQWSGAAAQTLSGVISGSGGLTKDGSGTLTLNAANTYSGATIVNGGTLAYNANTITYPIISSLSISSNATVRVNASSSTSLPVGNLTLNSNSILNLSYDFSGGNPTVAAVAVSGSLSSPGTNIVIRITGFGAAPGQFPLISYTGASPANLNNYVLSLPPGVTGNLVNNTGAKTIDVNVSTSSPTTWIPLIANDASGTSSITNSGNWQDGNPPTAGNGYYTQGFTLRSPADANPYTFAGSALSIDAYTSGTGGRFLMKGPGGATITITNLILNGGLVDYADSATAVETLAGKIALNSGTLNYLGAFSSSSLFITAPISGTGNLQIGGSDINGGADTGFVALSGANTYSGTTTVATGTLLANGTAPNTSVTVLTNGTFGGSGSIGGTIAVQAGGTLAPGILGRGALLNTIGTLTNGGGVSVFGSVLMKIDRASSPKSDKLVAPSVTFNPGATLTLTNIGSTNLVAGDTFALFSTPVTGSFTMTLPALPSPYLAWTNKLAVDGTIAVVVLGAQTVWDGGSSSGNNWSDGVNWIGDVAPGLATTNNLVFAGTTRLTPNMDGNYSAVGVTFDVTAGSFILGSSGGNVLALTGALANNSANPQTLNLALDNTGGAIAFSGANPIVLNGGVSGTGALQNDNSTVVTLSGTNTFTGGININSGKLRVAGAGLLSGTNGIYAGNIANSAVFQYSSSATQTLAGVISSSGILIKDGSGTLILAGVNTYTNSTIISNGVLQVTGTLGGGSYSGRITNNGTLQWSGGAAQTLNGVVSGIGGLTKDGSGTLILNAANTYSGATIVNGGTLTYNANTIIYPIINSLVINGGGTVKVNATNAVSLPVGNLTLNANSVLNLNYNFSGGNPTVAGVAVQTNLASSGTVTIRVSGFGAAVGQFPLVSYTGTSPANLNNYVLVSPPGVTGSLSNNTANKTIDLVVTASSPATWIPLVGNDAVGTNSFVNGLNWQDGNAPTVGNGYYTQGNILRSPADSNAYTFAGSALSIDSYALGGASGGRLLLKGPGGAVITVPDLILNGGLMDYANSLGDNGIKTVAGNILLNGGLTSYMGSLAGESLIVTAAINGTGNLQIGGTNVNVTAGGSSGIVVLAGANSYSGNTTVGTGTLLVNGTAPNTATSVSTNATLGGTGSLGGTVTVQPGGTLAPGIQAAGTMWTNTIGTLTAGGAVSVSGTVRLKIDRGGLPNSDKLTAASVTIGAGATLTVNNIGSTNFAVGDTFTLFSTAVSGSFGTTNLPMLAGGLAWTNKLAVNGTIAVVSAPVGPSAPEYLTNSYSGGVLSLSWPAGEGWRLQVQTNSLTTGLGTNWVYVTDGTISSTNITVGPGNGSVFYRLVYP